MHKQAHPKMTWLNDVESAIHTYWQQSSPVADDARPTKILRHVEHQIKDAKNLIRHSRAGHSFPIMMLTPKNASERSPAIRHDHEKAVHHYKRQLARYEHLKQMLRQDNMTA